MASTLGNVQNLAEIDLPGRVVCVPGSDSSANC